MPEVGGKEGAAFCCVGDSDTGLSTCMRVEDGDARLAASASTSDTSSGMTTSEVEKITMVEQQKLPLLGWQAQALLSAAQYRISTTN